MSDGDGMPPSATMLEDAANTILLLSEEVLRLREQLVAATALAAGAAAPPSVAHEPNAVSRSLAQKSKQLQKAVAETDRLTEANKALVAKMVVLTDELDRCRRTEQALGARGDRLEHELQAAKAKYAAMAAAAADAMEAMLAVAPLRAVETAKGA